jgi:hypothetical protein
MNNKPEQKTPKPMWRPPQGWFKAHCDERDENANRQLRIEDNIRRRQRGLPTYEV